MTDQYKGLIFKKDDKRVVVVDGKVVNAWNEPKGSKSKNHPKASKDFVLVTYLLNDKPHRRAFVLIDDLIGPEATWTLSGRYEGSLRPERSLTSNLAAKEEDVREHEIKRLVRKMADQLGGPASPYVRMKLEEAAHAFLTGYGD